MNDSAQVHDWWVPPGPVPRNISGPGRTQRRILMFLGEHQQESFSIPELAKHMQIHKGSASEGAKGLVQRRLVDVATPAGNGSVRRVKISRAGIDYLSSQPPSPARQTVPQADRLPRVRPQLQARAAGS